MGEEFIRFNSGKYSSWVTVEKNKEMGPHFVYILECENDKLYCGTTKDIIKRLVEHLIFKGSNFTKINFPIKLAHLELLPSYRDAINLETSIWKEINSGIRKKDDVGHCVMREYLNIFIIIQDLLKNHKPKWIIDKLRNLEEKDRYFVT